MEIRDHIPADDTELYIEAERESFKAAYPGVKVTTENEKYFLAAATHKDTHPDLRAFTLQEDNVPVGMISIHARTNALKPTCYVTNIYIQDHLRGVGAFELLFGAVEKFCKETGLRTISLDVSVQNERALSAYRKFGFDITHHSMMKTL